MCQELDSGLPADSSAESYSGLFPEWLFRVYLAKLCQELAQPYPEPVLLCPGLEPPFPELHRVESYQAESHPAFPSGRSGLA